MKKLTIYALLVSGLFIATNALSQGKNSSFRMQRPEETAFLNKLHQQLSGALPHAYKDWIPDKEDVYDALKAWCRDEGSWNRCLGWIPVSVGKSDPYGLVIQVQFNMDQSQSGPMMGAAVAMVKDYSDKQQVAAALKSTNKIKLTILLVMNLDIVGAETFKLSYCAKTPLQKLDIPVPTTLAVKGLRSTSCPIMDEGAVSLKGDYYDNALVFLGKPVNYKKTVTTSDGLTADGYSMAYDSRRISRMEVQNIAVEFKGDSADIDEAIKLIDWQKLSSLIEKP